MIEKAILVGVNLPNQQYSIEYTIEELKNLCKSCDINPLGVITQNLQRVNTATYVGSGKIEEIKDIISFYEATIVVFDDELSPSQLRNLEDLLDIKVIDRSLLILDIFSKRAKTQESQLEVKLAQLRYMLPRLAGLDSSLSRQGGNSGSFSSKGPGEKKIELDRRKIASEINTLELQLKQVKLQKQINRNKRSQSSIPIVALVGYTNSGKSTTMNTFLSNTTTSSTNKEVYAKDQLFATLDTSVRKVKLPNKQEIMLIDTVGFVSKLPHHLVNSFHTTLADIIDADLLIHVVDFSNEHYLDQIDVTNTVIDHILQRDVKQLYLLNKCDLLNTHKHFGQGDNILYSNKTLHNLDTVFNYITDNTIKENYKLIEINIPFTEAKKISYLEGYGITKMKLITNNYIYYKTYILKEYYNDYKQYLIGDDDYELLY